MEWELHSMCAVDASALPPQVSLCCCNAWVVLIKAWRVITMPRGIYAEGDSEDSKRLRAIQSIEGTLASCPLFDLSAVIGWLRNYGVNQARLDMLLTGLMPELLRRFAPEKWTQWWAYKQPDL